MTALGDLHDDGDLFAALGEVFETELPEVPPDLARFARDAWQWTAVEGELARLTSDSLDNAANGVRGPEDERFLIFESRTGTIELQVTPRLVVGRIQPEGTYEVILVTPTDDRQSVSSDVIGRFRAEVSAPFRVVVRGTEELVTTEWITS